MIDTMAKVDVRPFASLGAANHGWLDAHHHFSFAGYYDSDRMGWGSLRVWNDDIIESQTGFPQHPHSDMEIITYVRSGAISHKDNLGNSGRTIAGDVQVMSAGSGIVHSEYNLEEEATSIFQIWLLPNRNGGAPSWGTNPFPKADRSGSLQVLASGFAEDRDALPIRTEGRVLGATLSKGESVDLTIGEGRHGYLVPATGAIEVNGQRVNARDGAALGAGSVTITALEESEIVIVDTD